MLSRRYIRVKVMQTLYTLQANDSLNNRTILEDGQKILNNKLNQTYNIFTTIISYLTSITLYAESDARFRASKYIPTEADKNVNTKIAGNTFIWKILENETYKQKVENEKINLKINQEQIKKYYQQLCQTETYQKYCQIQERDDKSEKKIIRFVWTEMMINNDGFQSFISDEFDDWEDIKEMIYIMVDNFFKNVSAVNFLSLLANDKFEFATELLKTSIEKEDYCMSLIEPKLINWETERVAQIDLLLLRLGVSEILYFPTIPTKVTINEYIEIAKQYSTNNSAHFINAVLDKIFKDLESTNSIKKKSFVKK